MEEHSCRHVAQQALRHAPDPAAAGGRGDAARQAPQAFCRDRSGVTFLLLLLSHFIEFHPLSVLLLVQVKIHVEYLQGHPATWVMRILQVFTSYECCRELSKINVMPLWRKPHHLPQGAVVGSTGVSAKSNEEVTTHLACSKVKLSIVSSATQFITVLKDVGVTQF